MFSLFRLYVVFTCVVCDVVEFERAGMEITEWIQFSKECICAVIRFAGYMESAELCR